jgi:hypothetical protein
MECCVFGEWHRVEACDARTEAGVSSTHDGGCRVTGAQQPRDTRAHAQQRPSTPDELECATATEERRGKRRTQRDRPFLLRLCDSDNQPATNSSLVRSTGNQEALLCYLPPFGGDSQAHS